MNPASFIALLLPGALASQAATQVPAGFAVAQSALETGWLMPEPSWKGADHTPGYNLFGIKDTRDWTGATIDIVTHETRNGVSDVETDAFRAYPDYAASIVDHGKFLRENGRYEKCFETTDSCEFARRIEAAGYATGGGYAAKIIAIIHAHNLQQYDTPVSKTSQ